MDPKKFINLENLTTYHLELTKSLDKLFESKVNVDDVDDIKLDIYDNVATLDDNGKVDLLFLPSYVDDVVEYENAVSFPLTGESGKIYVNLSTNRTYRWSGSKYVEISESLAVGETESTAYAGNKGKQNADDIASLKENKLDTINDLDSIRSGAEAGATAVLPDAINDMETKTHASSTYLPKGNYLTEHQTLPTTLPADGGNSDTVNGYRILVAELAGEDVNTIYFVI